MAKKERGNEMGAMKEIWECLRLAADDIHDMTEVGAQEGEEDSKATLLEIRNDVLSITRTLDKAEGS